MMLKRMLAALCAFCLFFGAACAEGPSPVRIMVASDLHYIAPELFEGSNFFLRAIATADGKAAMYSAELLDALLAEVRHQQPDVLVLSGDLTFNGEKLSHQQLADALRTLQAEGITVAVIPGNHDICNNNAVHYLPKGYEVVDNVQIEDFAAIWGDLIAQELRGPGFGGVVKVNDRVWILMGEYSVYDLGLAPYGLATKAHREWVAQVAAEAKAQGVTLISVSHQALMPHTAMLAASFSVWYGEQLVTTLVDAGCKLNLSGHMHLQHILRLRDLTDIATGAWSMTPHRYAMVTVDEDGSLAYTANNVCPEHLPQGVPEATRAFFRDVTMDKVRPQLAALGLNETDIETMLTYAADVNEAYFAGTLNEHPEWRDHPAYDMWLRVSASVSFGSYLSTRIKESTEQNMVWHSQP